MIMFISQNAYVLLGELSRLTCLGLGDLYTTQEKKEQNPFPTDRL
jgi:hypothetical protein